MPLSRRAMLTLLASGTGSAAQTLLPARANIGFRADTGPARSECGVGALMPWAESLWAVTYNSHKKATGSGLALYRISDELKGERLHVHNGTHANRLIHHESNQCFIGPYAIGMNGGWRFIEDLEDHRLTATMRHLTDPANRVYQLTMEGLLMETDVGTLKSRVVANLIEAMKLTKRPHFKGGFTAQGRVVVANNGFYAYGEDGAGLFEWDGKAQWKRISGKPHMDVAARLNLGEVVFATGWDEASVLLWALVDGKWRRHRLPKASHAFEHAWQTEWMRIREVETEHFLADIQGSFFELQPIAFEGRIWGVKPICQHLRVIPDYTGFRGLLAVAGNETTANGDANPVVGQPQSGIWFGKTDDLWSWGKPQGWGGVWRKQALRRGAVSDPYLMTGYGSKVVHFSTDKAAEFALEADIGTGEWKPYARVNVPASGYAFHVFPEGYSAHWMRAAALTDCVATVEFIYT
ncbi:MAG: hypothetical protein IT166_23880 [Bryobacterales bacterium]|nr:hypothetical protein [Bryobacterales bacterium]